MAINVICSKCGRLAYASSDQVGKIVICPGCGGSIPIPVDASAATSPAMALACPRCSASLRLTRQLHGHKVRCTKCAAVLAVSADPWSLSVVGVPPPAASPPSMSSHVPAGMPPVPDGGSASDPATDPLAFLNESETPNIPSVGISTGEHPAQPNAVATAGKRPFGIVWIVFYWIFAGLMEIVAGFALSASASIAAGAATGMEDIGPRAAAVARMGGVIGRSWSFWGY